MNNFSTNLKKIRKDNNLSQEQLADELSVSRQAISKWESGLAYPEMDKIIQLCQKFEVNIDELLNKDIREVKEEREVKNNLNKYIDDFLHFITDTVNLFANMSFKTKIRCLLEQIIIINVLIIVFSILGGIGSGIFENIFYGWISSSIYYKITNVLSGIYLILAIIVSSIIFVHIFKTRYLDYYKKIKNSVNTVQEEINNKETLNITAEHNLNDNKNKILFKNNENKIIIRDPKHSEYRFINGIIKLLVLFVKFWVVLAALSLCLYLALFAAGLVVSFSVIKTGIFFIGLVLSMLSLIVGTTIVILLMFNFVFNRKNAKKQMIWSFIISVILFGAGSGLVFIGLLKFNVSNNISNDLIETKTFEIPMKDNLYITNSDNIEFLEKDINNVVIECDYNKNYEIGFSSWNESEYVVAHIYDYGPTSFEIIKTLIHEINNNQIINYNNEVRVRVYASRDNIEKIKTNILVHDKE